MAEGKKSFLLYCDLIHTVRKMPKDKAGELLLHILEYVNDENPETDDLLLQLVFEPIKQQLKRDLQKWSNISATRSEIGRLAGIKSGEARRNKLNQAEPNDPIGSKSNQNEHVSDSVSDTVNVNENKPFSKKKKKLSLEEYLKENKQKLSEAFSEYPEIKKTAFLWLEYKFKRKGYKETGWASVMISRIKSTSVQFIEKRILETIAGETYEDYFYSNHQVEFNKSNGINLSNVSNAKQKPKFLTPEEIRKL